MKFGTRRFGILSIALAIVATVAVALPSPASTAATPSGDRAYYVLPPGNYGGLPTTDQSLDQLPLYDALEPLRGNVTDADIEHDFLPENFQPVGATHVEDTGHPGTTVVYDSYGVP